MSSRYACIRAHDTTDCGPAALATIAEHYKLRIPISKIREIAGTDKIGTNAYGMVKAAEELGFYAKAVKGDKTAFEANFTLPAIALVVNKNSQMHYVVVHKKKSGKILSIEVENSATVNSGDILIRLDASYTEQQLTIVEESIKSDETNLTSLQVLKQSYQQDINLLSLDNPYYSTFLEYFAEKSIAQENTAIEAGETQNSEKTAASLSTFYKERIDNINSQISELERLQKAISGTGSFSSNSAYIQSVFSSFSNEYALNQQILEEAKKNYSDAQVKFANGNITQVELDVIKATVDNAELQLNSVITAYSKQTQTEIATAQAQRGTYEEQLMQLVSRNKAVDKSALLALNLEQLKERRISETETMIMAVEDEIASYQIRVTELKEQIDNSAIMATSAGVVMFEGELTAGMIIQPGSKILQIVPTAETCKVSLYVTDQDISKVKVGASLLLSVNALPYQEYGRLTGTVTYISATSVPVENVGQVYLVEAALPNKVLQKKDGTQETISAGMTVRASIVSGEETWMSWLLRFVNLTE